MKKKILIVVSTFYSEISDLLVEGACAAITASGNSYDIINVPGAFEVPAAIIFSVMGNRDIYDGYIALGCVIKGETDHYHYVSENVIRLIADISAQHAVAIGLGVLTVGNVALALERADYRRGVDIGGRAAKAAIRMIEVRDMYMAAGVVSNESA